MWILSTFMFFLGVQLGWTTQSCDKDKGPLGTIECLKFEEFEDQYQWATCLTSAHFLQNNNHTLMCSDRTRTFCWFTCMGEVHGVSHGSVASDCSCDPHRSSPISSLPRECYHPSGDNCYWYRTCWEKKYPCKPSDNGYMIRYAEKFCRVVEEHKAKLSPDAQEWMEAVRKCLQVNTAGLLDLGASSPTCNDIRKRVLNRYTACYRNPGNGASSICDLHCWQHNKIFWSIKASFNKLDTAWETFRGFWNIETTCPPFNIRENAKCFKINLQGVIKVLKLNVENLLRRKRRSSDPNSKAYGDGMSRFADEVGWAIASSLKWNTNVMDWIAYTARLVDLGNLDIVIMLADKKALGIVTGSMPFVDFNYIILEFASAVRKGKLRLQVQGYNVWVKSLSSCSDKSCDTTRTLATSNTPPWSSRPSSATEISHDTFFLCKVSALWIMLMKIYL